MPPATLDEILSVTRARVAALRPRARELERGAWPAQPPRPFQQALNGSTLGVIAEVKRRSPSAGAIREDGDAVEHALAYARGGAVAVSVLTDEAHFGGSLDDLTRVAQQVALPALRKDFILDELQVLEARAAGASAVLLIVRALAGRRLGALAAVARGQGLGVLVEVHTEAELERAGAASPTAIGVNRRGLASLAVGLEGAVRLLAQVPQGIPAVAASGIETRADVERVAAAGADLGVGGTAAARPDAPAAAAGA